MTNNLIVRVGQHKSGELEGFAKKYSAHGWFITKNLTIFSKRLRARETTERLEKIEENCVDREK
ncbi:MAG TPA: hypothetical protein VFA71_07270 [Terriglobales bacterium]|nr:hypothetical protein [Terriglobales bacterium]